MRCFSKVVIFSMLLLGACAASPKLADLIETQRQTKSDRPQLIVLTDIGNEPDDAESLVRLLLYTNEIDLKGIAAVTSRHLPATVNPQLIDERVDAYEEVFENLKVHDARYPDAIYIRQNIVTGHPTYGMTGVGEGFESSASQLIIDTVDKSDDAPVWVSVWGGASTLAQALWTVRETRSSDELADFLSKLRVYSISDQDDAGPWARSQFPSLFWVSDVHGFTQYRLATWTGISRAVPGADQKTVSLDWLSKHIIDQGPLGKLYPPPAYIVEGDTPSFLNLIPNGLSDPERPDWGGWGGRYEKMAAFLGLWTTTFDSLRGDGGQSFSSPQATIWRWREAFQNDFASRIQWSQTSDFEQANHAPEIILNGEDGFAPVYIDACPGEEIVLSATGSSDPDGDALDIRWFWYREAGGRFAPEVTLSDTVGADTHVKIAGTAKVDQFTPPAEYNLHVIAQITDAGSPALTRYRRAIINLPGLADSSAVIGYECAVIPIQPSH